MPESFGFRTRECNPSALILSARAESPGRFQPSRACATRFGTQKEVQDSAATGGRCTASPMPPDSPGSLDEKKVIDCCRLRASLERRA